MQTFLFLAPILFRFGVILDDLGSIFGHKNPSKIWFGVTFGVLVATKTHAKYNFAASFWNWGSIWALEEAQKPPRNHVRDHFGVPEHVLEPHNEVWGSDFRWFLLTCLVVCASKRFLWKLAFHKLAFLSCPRKALPSRTSKRILLVDQNAGHTKISTTTKGFAFKLNIPRCPRKALPSNAFLRAGLSKASTKDFVCKLAFLNYLWKACLQGLQKEYYWLTKMVGIPKYPRKA